MSEPVVVLVPQINPNDEHAVVVQWHVAKGARVRVGDPLVTMETTKTTFDVDSPSDGYAYYELEPNAELAVGAPVAWIADTDRPPQHATLQPPARASTAHVGQSAGRFTHKARKLMKEHGLAEADFPGDERVEAEAVERAAAARVAHAAPRAPAGARPLELSPAKITEIQTLRRVHEQAVPSTVAVSLSADKIDARLALEGAAHGPVSLLELAIHEAARLLPEWAELNGFYADGRAWAYEHVAIGFAVNLGRSLRVPVVKGAGEQTLREVAGAVRDLTMRYLRGELAIDDVRDGTFTITDLSGEGVVHFVPMLNERQSAILGVCAARNDRSRDLVLTFDHRLSDGMRAGRFLAALRDRLERAPRLTAMLFNSLTFVVFYVVVFALYWLLRARASQNVLLLAASWIFYGAWSWKFLLLLIGSSVLDYCAGLLIERASSQERRRLVLVISVAGNLLFLATFKYFGFFVAELAVLLERMGFDASLPVLSIVLPVGISFYTFQTIGYVVDVYRRKVPAARSFLDYALYVAFFPQLVAGPIERAGHLIPQIQKPRVWSTPAFESGLQLAIWGLFKKIVIADNLAPYVDAVYSSPGDFAGLALTTATVFFAFQIYCDFSGYTDTARGVARMLGFDLMRNFDFPYISRTPVEFWRRWHISLSQWFQDYLYYPLAMRYMRRGGFLRKYKAHIVSMALIGIWHGANWTFLVFGLYWGVVIAVYLAMLERTSVAADAPSARSPGGARLRDLASVALMFVIVCVGWVLFRAESMSEAWYLLTHLLSASGAAAVSDPAVAATAVLWSLIAGLLLAEWFYRRSVHVRTKLEGAELPAVAGRYALLAAIIVSAGASQFDEARPFIYFQF